MSQELTVIGVMSGTSLDGLDICAVRFSGQEDYEYEILASETFTYPKVMENGLAAAFGMKDQELKALDLEYGRFIGDRIVEFNEKHQLNAEIDLIGSHGHTVYHDPSKGITVQIGDGQQIANITNCEVVNDFRIKDVQLGGQGAPLVPIGDKFLFSSYESCLNLGGIANISFDDQGQRVAFDICPANLPLNKLVRSAFGSSYDLDGEIARSGKQIDELLAELNDLNYYLQEHPKSLGVEWLNDHFYPVLQNYSNDPPANLLRTIVEHETGQIDNVLKRNDIKSCLVSGGGALNLFFMERLKAKSSTELIIPGSDIVDFKEALIFAFLAFLNYYNQINTLKSVTGAKRDSVGGIRYAPLHD
jgi:anhydro-N-acetylmuramic acid kinase